MGIKHKVNEKFFDRWSPEMAYILGYIYADGTLINCDYIRARYVSITSTDKISLERIKRTLDSEHTITSKKSSYLNGKIVFNLKIGNHHIYNSLLKLGLLPNKSLIIKFPDIPLKYIEHFIRGYFDGDGCVYFERRKGKIKEKIIKRIRTIFTSGSKIFLDKMNTILISLDICNGKIYKSHRSFQLILNNKDSIFLFKLMYKRAGHNGFFMRKFKIFNDYFDARPIKTDPAIRKILNTNKTATW